MMPWKAMVPNGVPPLVYFSRAHFDTVLFFCSALMGSVVPFLRLPEVIEEYDHASGIEEYFIKTSHMQTRRTPQL